MITAEVSGRVAVLTLARAPVNAIDAGWLEAFNAVLDRLAARGDWHVLHLKSGVKVFSAGADLAEMRQRLQSAEGIEAMVRIAAGMQSLFARIEALPQVSIAELGGAALGGGFELALACDLRVAANVAKIGLPEASLGLVPGAGGTQRLTRLAGRGLASRLILCGEVLDGARAAALGLVQWSAPRAELPARAAGIAAQLAALPAETLAASKACIAAAADPAGDGFEKELEASRRLYGNRATLERVDQFLGRRQ
jgi:enoyl-CoA hydratase/carnithine racemase